MATFGARAERARLTRLRAALAAGAVLAACAELPIDKRAATPAETELASLGELDAFYDRAGWAWAKNADGRMLLKHREIAQCFLDPEPPQDFQQQRGIRLTRENRTIAATRYEVVTAYEGRDFWEAIYLRAGSLRPLLGVYAGGQCQQEAERILEAYEKRR